MTKIFLTGATSGFGTHLSRALVEGGFLFVAHGREARKLSALKKALSKKHSRKIEALEADMLTPAGLNALISRIARKDITVLINNAGVNPELEGKPVIRNDILRVNAEAPIELSKALFKHRSGQSRTIINMNSVAGIRGSVHEPIYSASKSALRRFSESVKDAWAKEDVRVMDVYSGALATGMSSQRPDVRTLIDPKELAEFIVSLLKTKSFFVRDISVQKTSKRKRGKRRG